MTLLDMLTKQVGLDLIVAHVNHGIRSDSSEDEKLVRLFCMSHNIKLVFKKLHLGDKTSEEIARKARYKFLQLCRIKYKADAIVTAHHRDDLVETVIINLLRGTGWRGLAPFNQAGILRPLINTTKKSLISYAKKHNISWREDSTNNDQKYLRNLVRHSLIPKMQKIDRQWQSELLRQIRKQIRLRRKIETQLNVLLTSFARQELDQLVVSRYSIIALPQPVDYEFMQQIFRLQLGNSLVRELAEKAVMFAKDALPAKRLPLNATWQLRVTKTELIVEQYMPVVS